jgi:hypothetical protein
MNEQTKPDDRSVSLPEWTRGLAYMHPLAFQSGRHWAGTAKRFADMTREEKIAFYLASRGRGPPVGGWGKW